MVTNIDHSTFLCTLNGILIYGPSMSKFGKKPKNSGSQERVWTSAGPSHTAGIM